LTLVNHLFDNANQSFNSKGQDHEKFKIRDVTDIHQDNPAIFDIRYRYQAGYQIWLGGYRTVKITGYPDGYRYPANWKKKIYGIHKKNSYCKIKNFK
jgi:hypothetical protein